MKRYKKLLILPLTLLIITASSVIVFKLYKKFSRPYLTVVGTISMRDGLGRQSAELIDILKDDLDISFKRSRKTSLQETPAKICKIIKNKDRPIGKVIIYEDWLGEKRAFFKKIIKGPKNPNHIRIAYSMFESSLIPPEWVQSLNTCFDLVAVPDKFLIETYKNSGVTIPIFELPLSLNLEEFLNLPLKNKRKSPLVFANLSSFIPRKNQLKLIRAFYAAFGNSSDVKLRLNGRYSNPQYREAIKNEIHHLDVTNIEFTEMKMDTDFYLKMFQDIDCYVSLSSGEGFPIQPREAMALGIPTIVTDNTGQSTICSSDLVRVVPSLTPTPAIYSEFARPCGVFYECETEDVIKALKDIYENYDRYLEQKNSARDWVKQYDYSTLRPLYLGLIKPKKIVLGNTNKITPECLYTDSEELCEKFNKLLGVYYGAIEDRKTHEKK